MKNSKKTKSILFLPQKKKCEFSGQPSVLEIAIAHELPLNHSCGGLGSCTTCLVKITKGLESLGPRQELEQEHANMRGFADQERLACQITAKDGLEITIPIE